MKYKKILLKSIIDPQPGDAENYIIRGVFSTGTEDRQGDIVVQNGWILNEFLQNPVVLFAHDHWQPAVAKVIELGFNEAGNLSGAIQFAANEYDFAMTLYKLYAGGYMRGFSVGFDAIEGGYDDVNNVMVLTQNVLYELSLVNVGASAEALAVQAGIDVSPLKKFFDTAKAKAKSILLKVSGSDTQIEQKIKELKDCGYDEDQAKDMSFNICGNECEIENTKEKEKSRCEIKERLNKIERAIREFKSLTAIKKNGRQPSKEGKKILIKSLNKTIRFLLSERNKEKSKIINKHE